MMITGKVPSYVVAYQKTLDKIKRHDRWVLNRILPAPRIVQALIEFFKKALRVEKEREEIRPYYKPDEPKYHARYWPANYLPILRSEVRKREYRYFLMTLRMHASALSAPQHPERWQDPARKSNAYQLLSIAPDVLEAVGEWWIETDRTWCPRLTPAERKALQFCARIYRQKEKALEDKGPPLVSMSRATKTLEWMTRHLSIGGYRGNRST